MTITNVSDIVRHAGDADLPWADAGDGVELKVLRVDANAGVWVLRNRFAPGVRLQRHRHTGEVHGFTLSGRWRYLEYDFESTAGSFIHEPAGSTHTLDVPTDNDGPTDVLFIIQGVLLNLDADDNVEWVADWNLTLDGYYGLLEGQGLPRPTGILQ